MGVSDRKIVGNGVGLGLSFRFLYFFTFRNIFITGAGIGCGFGLGWGFGGIFSSLTFLFLNLFFFERKQLKRSWVRLWRRVRNRHRLRLGVRNRLGQQVY